MAQVPVEVSKPVPAAVPSDPWTALRKEMDQVFDRFGSGFGFPSLHRMADAFPALRPMAAGWQVTMPAIDIAETDTAFKLTAELPGLSEADVDISVADGMLVLKGEKQQQKEETQPNYRLTERSYGSFERAFTLPDTVDIDHIDAAFAKGVLTVTLPKLAQDKPAAKKIEVKAAA